MKHKKIKHNDSSFPDNQTDVISSKFNDPGDDEKKVNPSTAMLGQVIMTRRGRRALRRRKRQGL